MALVAANAMVEQRRVEGVSNAGAATGAAAGATAAAGNDEILKMQQQQLEAMSQLQIENASLQQQVEDLKLNLQRTASRTQEHLLTETENASESTLVQMKNAQLRQQVRVRACACCDQQLRQQM
jgi:hypothetical protein